MTVADIVICGVIGGIAGYFGGMLALYMLKRNHWGR
jgi:phage shock protein PspC (stress-responsive transcriptional regulator)